MLQLADGKLLTDTPQYERESRRIPLHREVSASLSINGKRYGFETAIETPAIPVDINDRHRVRGMALRVPDAVAQTQRRADYRVSVAGLPPLSVSLATPHERHPSACRIDALRATGRLVDLSVGGARVVFPVASLSAVPQSRSLLLGFELPPDAVPLALLANLRHSRLVAGNDMLRLGFAFVPCPGVNLRAAQRRISRFIAAQQRRLLQRRKP